MKFNRRDFLKASLGSLTYFSMASTVPLWISKSAQAVAPGLGGDRILVIVQQSGGNDGLNTVIPFTDPLYNGDVLRPNLHIVSGLNPTTIDGLNAFHPKLIRLKDWFDQGDIAVIQNVGYPNPDLSHFVATDYWEFGNSPGSASQTRSGWMARFIDNQCAGMPADSIDPLTMLAAKLIQVPGTFAGSALYTPPAVLDFDFYRIFLPEQGAWGQHIEQYIRQMNDLTVVNPNLDFVQRAANLAEASTDDIQEARMVPPINTYPAGDLGAGLDMVSKVIRGGFGTKVFYVSQGGYDTHANQFAGDDPANLGDHPRLLDEFDQALDAFLNDMDASGDLDRVCIMTFSEFGRRVDENGSKGTDHGGGNCLFVMGGGVVGGVYGDQPDLSDLIIGNLKHNVDFRSVYSRILQDWFRVDPEPIFGETDYNDPILDIQGGMAKIPIFNALGDVNNDGVVNAQDIQKVVNTAIGIENDPLTDVNNDGRTNAADVQLVINAAVAKRKRISKW